MNLIEKVKEVIERESLIPEGSRVIVGISGGADSVALLHSLHRLGYEITVAHLNHCIRGAEADVDEQFVKDLCTKLGVECITAKTDVPALAKEKSLSLEMAAREARHHFFRSLTSGLCVPAEALAKEGPLTSVICLAHHADDQLETFFLRAARGSGPSGLGGMRPVQEMGPLRLVRPMLSARRSEIVEWLTAQGMEWCEEESNADESIPRNRVRHQILPLLGTLNECAAENILRAMAILRDEADHPEKAAARREARDRLIDFGVSPTFDAVEQLVEFAARTDGTAFLDLEGGRLVNEYGVVRTENGGGFQPLASGRMPLPQVKMKKSSGILRGKWQGSVSLAKIDNREVTVRAAQPGDRMNPFGMEGSRKLQDIFTDLKIPQSQRADWPVAECDGEIIWLPGYRIARGWALSSDTEPALHLFCERRDQTG